MGPGPPPARYLPLGSEVGVLGQGPVVPVLALRSGHVGQFIPSADNIYYPLRAGALGRAIVEEVRASERQQLVVTAARRAPEAPEQELSTGVGLRRGSLVQLHGLKSNLELNGRVGKLLRFSAKRRRWHVDVPGGHGIKSVSPENMEPLPDGSFQGAFENWRTSRDLGGRWEVAEAGVLVRLADVKEKDGLLVCKFTTTGITTLQAIANPWEFAERSEPLRAEVQVKVDRDEGVDLRDEEQGMMELFQEVLQLCCERAPGGDLLELQPKLEIAPSLGSATKSLPPGKAGFWEAVRAWHNIQHLFVFLRRLKLAIARAEETVASAQAKGDHVVVTGEQVQKLVEEFQSSAASGPMTVFERLELEATVPLQPIFQAASYRDRLSIFRDALLRERRRLLPDAGAAPTVDMTTLVDVSYTPARDPNEPRSRL